MHELFRKGLFTIVDCHTSVMAADIFTKFFIDVLKWGNAILLIGIIDGKNIAKYGGVFKISEGFLEEFGPDRIKNTPIIESGIIGAAMGMALEGMKPIVEMQFADFVSCGFNQIVNNIAKTHYRWNEALNITIRMPYGGGMSAGPFHSQSPEAWFFHTPGLKIVAPSTPYDAKGLLQSSIDDPNPVLYFEHKYMYRSIKGLVPKENFNIVSCETCDFTFTNPSPLENCVGILYLLSLCGYFSVEFHPPLKS